MRRNRYLDLRNCSNKSGNHSPSLGTADLGPVVPSRRIHGQFYWSSWLLYV